MARGCREPVTGCQRQCTFSRATVTYILHHALRFLYLTNELVLFLQDFCSGLFRQVCVVVRIESSCLRLRSFRGFSRVQTQPAGLHSTSGFGRKLYVGIESRCPSRQESTLNLSVLGESCLSNFFFRQGVLLERTGERILRRVSRR